MKQMHLDRDEYLAYLDLHNLESKIHVLVLDCGIAGYVNYVINTSEIDSKDQETDGYQIRRCAVENNVAMFTALDTVKVLLDVLEEITLCISTIDE